MKDTFSLYEAKAKLSAIVRRVREGHPVTVTVHGEPVVEIRPLPVAAGGLAGRLQLLEERGIISPARAKRRQLKMIARRPGALQRFLEDRDA